MEDPDLEAIHQARICELQAAAAAGGGSKSSEDDVTRISIVKVEKARTVKDLLIRMAQPGQLRGRLDTCLEGH
ncbi:12236_t:CDS:2 [Gigaspora rosea]|nr:12236_t:CDS:2 [Gigaspora rosea]